MTEGINKRGAVRKECIACELVEVGEEKVDNTKLDHVRSNAVVVDQRDIDETLKVGRDASATLANDGLFGGKAIAKFGLDGVNLDPFRFGQQLPERFGCKGVHIFHPKEFLIKYQIQK